MEKAAEGAAKMRLLRVTATSALVVLGIGFLIPLQAQDFQRTYAIAAGGQIRIGNISGDIRIQGYNGDSILVQGIKTGRDRDKVEVEDLSSANRIEIRVRYPEHGNADASINFEVRVPSAVSYIYEKVASISGSVNIADVKGQIRAQSISGNVMIRNVAGMVSASSVSGDVEAEITRLEGRGEMKFSSVSGDVAVRAPANLDADVEMSTLSGSLKTDYPIEVQERRYGPGRSARGRLGSGAIIIKVSSVSGRVALSRSS
jgi:hypothetical protein